MTSLRSMMIFGVTIALLAGAASLADFDLTWHTVDGGGGIATGGGFELSGTIGQPGAGAMTGGGFELTGGFWAAPPASNGCTRDPEWICDGDVDGDRQVNPVDSGLVQAVFGSADEQNLCNYDLDCDGQINPVDAGIVQSLFGTCEEPRDVCLP